MLRFLSGSVKSGSCGSDFLETILLVEECVSKKVVHTSDLNTELRNCAAQVADFWTGRVGETVAICLMFILDDDFTCKKVRITKLQGCRFVPYTFSETIRQMVPSTGSKYFQGLAWIQGQIYNNFPNV